MPLHITHTGEDWKRQSIVQDVEWQEHTLKHWALSIMVKYIHMLWWCHCSPRYIPNIPHLIKGYVASMSMVALFGTTQTFIKSRKDKWIAKSERVGNTQESLMHSMMTTCETGTKTPCHRKSLRLDSDSDLCKKFIIGLQIWMDTGEFIPLGWYRALQATSLFG